MLYKIVMNTSENIIFRYFEYLLSKNDEIIHLNQDILNPKNELERLFVNTTKNKSYYERYSEYILTNENSSLLEHQTSYLDLLNEEFDKLRSNTNVYDFFRKKIKVIPEFKYEDNFLWNTQKVNPKFIKSLQSSFDYLKNLDAEISFYRGHSNMSWKLSPSIYRFDWINNENSFYRDILIRNPENFSKAKSTFEKLTIMQHHGLPTRLLDISLNPMVALWFACSDNTQINEAGEIFIFKSEKNQVKYYDSDTVSVISNLAKIERNFKIESYNVTEFNKQDCVAKLLHQIKEEKPYFENIINPKDLNKSIIVKPVNNSDRIKRQMGYFILVGIDTDIKKQALVKYSENINNNIPIRYIIPPENKHSILNDLEIIGISSNTLFPEIDNGTEFLKNK